MVNRLRTSLLTAGLALLLILPACDLRSLVHTPSVAAHALVPDATDLAPDVEWGGDSLTAGYYATLQTESFRSIVEAHFQVGDIEIPGTGPGVAAAQLSSAFANGQTSVVPANLIVIELGTNDFGQGYTLSQFDANYSNVVWWVRRSAPTSRLLCLGIYNLESWTNQAGASAAQFDSAISYYCANQGGTYVSLQPFADDRGPAGQSTYLGTSDSFHPNSIGHEGIAWAIICAVAGDCQG